VSQRKSASLADAARVLALAERLVTGV